MEDGDKTHIKQGADGVATGDSGSSAPRSQSAATAAYLAEKLLAAHEGVRAALIEFLEQYDPWDEQQFRYVVSQTLNLTKCVEEISSVIGVSSATMHRWASGVSTPIPAARAVVAVILKQALVEGVPSLLTDKTRTLKASAEAARDALLSRKR